MSYQNEQVPAPRIQLYTTDLDLPRRVHSVSELRQGVAAETQAEDLYRETGQRSHGTRVGTIKMQARVTDEFACTERRDWEASATEAEDRKQESEYVSERGN